eukprot:TRINITY_DN615_c0_g1_i2.p1 TRINITY_DN615_c0_g1~~TRINITY_DN615_c0_g1_i2.p1  ORF type:complete len:929 (-),score=284.34 TRINITY_DN615_c0_g1_i2:129-2915(-)
MERHSHHHRESSRKSERREEKKVDSRHHHNNNENENDRKRRKEEHSSKSMKDSSSSNSSSSRNISLQIDPEKQKVMEERRKKLEAFKKSQEEQKEKESSSSPLMAVDNKEGNNNNTPISLSFPSSKVLDSHLEDNKAVISQKKADDLLDNNSTSEMEVTHSSSSKDESNEDEVDPLDAFMANLNEGMEEKETKKNGNSLEEKANSQKSKRQVYYDSDEDIESEGEKSGEEEKEDGEESSLMKKLQKKTLTAVDHSKMDYPSFKKNFYIEVPEISRMTKEEVEKYKEELENIRTRGSGVPKPVKSFAQCGLSNKVLSILERQNYHKPSPIQCQAIPAIMSGRDIIACAKTGSGKTLCFLLPLLRHIADQPPVKQGEGPIAIVMAPTRELATQIHEEFKKFTKPLDIRCVCVYGGSQVASQISDLKRGAEIVVCTPGRMIDILCTNRGRVTNLSRVTFLVLDEADRMFDMGFEPQIMRIINNIRPDRQTTLFSATFPRSIEVLARKILVKPLEIIVGTRSVVCSDVTQVVEVRGEETKFRRLAELLKEFQDKGSIIIFVDRQEAADKLRADIEKAGYPCSSLHGGLEQQEREFTIDDFKRKGTEIMVATSVAARGLDVKELNLVINYDVPNHMEDYVHRVGRTGRAGAKGTAYTFITPDEDKYASDILKALENSKANVPDALKSLVEAHHQKFEAGTAQNAGSGFGGKGWKFDASEQLKKEEEKKKQRKAAGLEEDQEENVEVLDEDGEIIPNEPETTSTNHAPLNTPQEKTPSTELSKESSTITKPQSAAEQALAQIQGGSSSIPSKQSIQAKLQEIANRQPKQASLNAGNHFSDELEINDYPQQARWKVTHKDALASICELTNSAITTKGSYVPPGRPLAPGERKLYLFIESPDMSLVKQAKAEVMKILDDAMLSHQPEKQMYGKYKV